jgi:hypothetical protein
MLRVMTEGEIAGGLYHVVEQGNCAPRGLKRAHQAAGFVPDPARHPCHDGIPAMRFDNHL